MITGNPTAKFLLFAYLDERIEWPEMEAWAEQLGIGIREIIDLQEACAMTRRSGWTNLHPVPADPSSKDASAALAFAYAHGWIGFDDVARWCEDREMESDDLLRLLEGCALEGHANGLLR